MILEFCVPGLRIESANRTRDRHWAIRKRKTDEQRELVYWAYRAAIPQSGTVFAKKWWRGKPSFTVTLTRIAPRQLDEHDNLRSGFKAAVDLIAELLEVDDADERVKWVYEQERGAPKQYAVRIKISSEDHIKP